MSLRSSKHQGTSSGARRPAACRFFRNIIKRLGFQQAQRRDSNIEPEKALILTPPIPQQIGRPENQHLDQPKSTSVPTISVEQEGQHDRGTPHAENAATLTIASVPTTAEHPEQLESRNEGREGSNVSMEEGRVITLAVPESLSRQRSGRAETNSPGFLANASNCNLQNTVMNLNYYDHDHVMETLEKHTIRGAEFDSSDRYPPPLCHPGTRKSIVEKAQGWFRDTERQKRILWFVGSAGSGKSAIMQTLAEWAAASPDLTLGATLFFSRPNGRNNPSKVFITLACQLAVACPPYREFVVQELVSNPRLPLKSITTQFARLIVEPFVQQKIHRGSHELLIFLDGLDECEGERAQCDIIELISSFSLEHPNTPITWIIASRPESHLRAVFSRKNVTPSCEKEEVPIDSDEACADVEKYLRQEFERIHQDDPILHLQPYWPTETEFLIITAAAGGLFVFASTAIKFVDDPTYGNPASGLALLLAAINKASLQPLKGRNHPLAHLDALYAFILSEIPSAIRPDTNLLLTNNFALSINVPKRYEHGDGNLVFLCNWIGMSSHDAYSALRRLHSVLTVPSPEEADALRLSFHHQSFYEYLNDRDRSQAFWINTADMDAQEVACSLRILKEAYLGAAAEDTAFNTSEILLSWSTSNSVKTQQALHERAAWSITGIIDRYDPCFVLPMLQDPDVVRLTKVLNLVDPRTLGNNNCKADVEFLRHIYYQLDSQIRSEFEKLKLLWEAPIGIINLDNVDDKGWMYVRCERNIDKPVRLNAETICGPYPIEYDSEYRNWWCTNPTTHDGGKEKILRDLRDATAQTPDLLVLFFGNATRTYVLYEYKTPDGLDRWTHYVPYRLLEGTPVGV